MNKTYLSIIVPVFNEEKRIGKCIQELKKYFSTQKYSYEIIFVDDGSTDETVEKIKVFKLISYKINRGKGYAVRKGVAAAQGKYILFMDADLSTPPQELEKLLPFTNDFSVIIGSRYLNNTSIKIKQPFFRRVLSRSANLLIKIMLGLDFYDTQCGFKLFENSAAKAIFSRATINRWGFDIEILAIAKRLGYNVREVAVDWFDDPRSRLRAGRAAWQTLQELFTIKKNILKGKYK